MAVAAYTATSCLGHGSGATLEALRSERTFLEPCQFMDLPLSTFVGQVEGVDDIVLDGDLARFDCRNNRLAALTLRQDDFDDAVLRARARFGADRIGVFLGSSTSGILSTELAYRRRAADTGALPVDFDYAASHNMYSLAAFVSACFGLSGCASVISIACASSAKAFASGARAISAGLVDAAIVGGVDSLCLTTLYGFGSLELLSPEPCRPFDAARSGVSIGEAGAFALLMRPQDAPQGSPLLSGHGESSDAWHLSAPHPQGRGARQAMHDALVRARLDPSAIDYINLHGTATPSNDAAEDAAVVALFGEQVPVSSTKGAHGHTLGAAGALEAVIALLALEHGLLPGGVNVTETDAALRVNYRLRNESRRLAHVMSNSFGFGGANASLVFSLGAGR